MANRRRAKPTDSNHPNPTHHHGAAPQPKQNPQSRRHQIAARLHHRKHQSHRNIAQTARHARLHQRTKPSVRTHQHHRQPANGRRIRQRHPRVAYPHSRGRWPRKTLLQIASANRRHHRPNGHLQQRMGTHHLHQFKLFWLLPSRTGTPQLAGLEPTARAPHRFFGTTGGLLSPKDVEVLTDVIPLVYHVPPSEILNWRIDEAMRRYHLAAAKLGINKG
jgi:hypothetical protein